MLRRARFGVRQQPSLFSIVFVARSKQSSPLHWLREVPSKARQYALTLGRKLARFLEFPELDLHRAAVCSELQSREVWQNRESFTFLHQSCTIDDCTAVRVLSRG